MSHTNELRKRYEVWSADEGTQLSCVLEGTVEPHIFGDDAKILFSLEASTHEEAMSIYHLRMGFEPYKPLGESAKCPNECGASYYPLGSGECPFCGLIDEYSFNEYIIDASDIGTSNEFWNRYIEIVQPDGLRYFGKNLDALWDALDGGGPGFPGDDESTIKIINSQNLKSIRDGKFLDALQKISNDLSLKENSVVKLIIE